MRIVFVCYGVFNSNSGAHVANFANGLAALGHDVAMVAEGKAGDVHDILEPQFTCFSPLDVDLDPDRILSFGDPTVAPCDTIIHAWTPREKVRALVERLHSCGARNYFVHLEDNEEVITAANLGLTASQLHRIPEGHLPEPFPLSLSHPLRYKDFLARATGVTVIVKTLERFVPNGIPVHLLEPGVDVTAFDEPLSVDEDSALRAELGIRLDEIVCVYHGNMHAANRREIFSLYNAFSVLRRRGRPVRLIRTGKDFGEALDVSYSHLKCDVVELGFVDRDVLIKILKLASFFVQPGTSNPFNDYRFPSKIPEFLAAGRPVVIPATNIALQMTNGREALFLTRGDGQDIADCVERVLDDPRLAQQLGRMGRAFALSSLDWGRNSNGLAKFYARCLNEA